MHVMPHRQQRRTQLTRGTATRRLGWWEAQTSVFGRTIRARTTVPRDIHRIAPGTSCVINATQAHRTAVRAYTRRNPYTARGGGEGGGDEGSGGDGGGEGSSRDEGSGDEGSPLGAAAASALAPRPSAPRPSAVPLCGGRPSVWRPSLCAAALGTAALARRPSARQLSGHGGPACQCMQSSGLCAARGRGFIGSGGGRAGGAGWTRFESAAHLWRAALSPRALAPRVSRGHHAEVAARVPHLPTCKRASDRAQRITRACPARPASRRSSMRHPPSALLTLLLRWQCSTAALLAPPAAAFSPDALLDPPLC